MGAHQGIAGSFHDFVQKASENGPFIGYTYSEVAAALKVSVQTIEVWVKRGRIPSPDYHGVTARFGLESLKLIFCGVKAEHTYPVSDSPRAAIARAAIAAKKKRKGQKTHNQKVVADRNGLNPNPQPDRSGGKSGKTKTKTTKASKP